MDDKSLFVNDESAKKKKKNESSEETKDKKKSSQPFVVPEDLKKKSSEETTSADAESPLLLKQSKDDITSSPETSNTQSPEETTSPELVSSPSLKKPKDDHTSSPETSESPKESSAPVSVPPSSGKDSEPYFSAPPPEVSESPNETKDSTRPQSVSKPPVDNKTSQEEARKSHPESGPSDDSTSGNKPSYFKRKRSSIVKFFTGKSPEEIEREEEPPRPKRKKRPSFVKRKFLALEKELTMDNINKKVSNVFVPDFFKKGQEEEEEEEEGEEVKQDDGKIRPKKTRLSSAMACLFIVGATTGSAIASLPFFLKQTSWFGVFLNLLLGFNSLYAGLCTGWCWTIMEERWPEYLDYSRIPYQDIAYRAVGRWMQCIVAICIDISLVGTCASYILLMADSFGNVIQDKVEFCYLLIILIFITLPFIMFGSYKNVKFIGVGDLLFSILFTVILIVAFFLDKPSHGITSYTDPSLNSVVLAFAGFSFAYGSGAVLPSILADMENRDMFTHTCVTAYMIVMALYIVLPIMGYAAYGDDTTEFILEMVFENESTYTLGLVIDAIHILQLGTTFVIALFPTLHAFEVRLNCPDRFGLFRFMIRVIILILILVLILGWPDLPRTMAIVGATTLNLATFIFPPVFYVCLVYRQKQRKKRYISKKMWLLIVETVILGMVVGIVSTYVAVNDFRSAPSVRIACYVNMTAEA